jgi:hypothetical protein
MKAGISVPVVFPEPLDESSVRRADDPDAHEKYNDDGYAQDKQKAKMQSFHTFLLR